MNKRYHDLDALRAFAMLLGILLHGMISFVPTPIWPAQDVNQSELYGIPLAAIHGFRMPIFFFVSGFFTMMMWKKHGTLQLLAHRFKRIVLPLVLSGIVFIPLWKQAKILAEWKYDGRENIEKYVEKEESTEKPVGTPIDKEADSWLARNYLTGGQFMTLHLWFLYDLIYLVAGFVILANILKFLPLSSFVAWLAESPLRLVWLIPLTYWAQFNMAEQFGADTTVVLDPNWIKLGYFAIFFGYGAICFGHSGFIEKIGRRWPLYFLLSIPALYVGIILFETADLEFEKEVRPFAGACYVWLMIFGLIGVFRKFFSNENPKVRYLSDSAYWLYLAHLPFIQVIQLWVSEWPLPSLIKLIFVCVVTTALLLASYRYLIRYTWVGTLMNGKRAKPHYSS